MEISTLAFFVWFAVAVVQIVISLQFLERLKDENPDEYDRIDGDGQKGWLFVIPMTVGSAYGDAFLHDMWGLSDSTKRLGRRLRRGAVICYITLLGCVAALAYQYL